MSFKILYLLHLLFINGLKISIVSVINDYQNYWKVRYAIQNVIKHILFLSAILGFFVATWKRDIKYLIVKISENTVYNILRLLRLKALYDSTHNVKIEI